MLPRKRALHRMATQSSDTHTLGHIHSNAAVWWPAPLIHLPLPPPTHIPSQLTCSFLPAALHTTRIRVADPTKRINLDGIYSHPWFLKNLPPGVREMNDRTDDGAAGLQVIALSGPRARTHAHMCTHTRTHTHTLLGRNPAHNLSAPSFNAVN